MPPKPYLCRISQSQRRANLQEYIRVILYKTPWICDCVLLEGIPNSVIVPRCGKVIPFCSLALPLDDLAQHTVRSLYEIGVFHEFPYH